jgi:methylmalonyl-CoA mutase
MSKPIPSLPTLESWRAHVEADLKGAPFDKKMVSPTPEGIRLQPLYTVADVEGLLALNSLPGFPPYIRGNRASGYTEKPWDISQELDFASAAEFNEAARNSVERGLTALNIVLDKATRNGHDPDWAELGEVGTGGLSLASIDDLDRALSGIDLEKISLFIRSGSSAMPVAALLVSLVRRRGKDISKLTGCIEMDPLGVLSHEGGLPQSIEGAYREMSELTRWMSQHKARLQTICVHTRAWHESGGNAVQELAFGLATGAEYLRAMSERGLSVNHVAPRMRVAMTVGNQFFMEIAKLRAMRLMWSSMVNALGGDDAAQRVHIHARTSHRNKTVYDPHVNILRGTVEALAAILGGSDSLQVGAFDDVFRTPDDFSRRLARNTQIILAKECGVTTFIDPAGGSWYLEKLSDELARKAWELFQNVEHMGGMSAALKKGFVQAEVERVARERIKAIETRATPIIGTTKYANPKEIRPKASVADAAGFHRKRRHQIASYRTQADDLENQSILKELGRIVQAPDTEIFDACVDAVTIGATLGEITRSIRIVDRPVVPARPVELKRSACWFEELRDNVSAFAAAQHKPVTVFLATMGPSAQHRARADFSKGFFEVAGFNVVYPGGFNTPEEAVNDALKVNPSIVTICSTDETYPELVPSLLKAFKQKFPEIVVVLAGYPVEHIDSFRRAGVDEFIHLKANALDVLTELFKKVEGAYVAAH